MKNKLVKNKMILFKFYKNCNLVASKSLFFSFLTLKTQLKLKISVLIQKIKLNSFFFLLCKHSFLIFQKNYIKSNSLLKNKRIFYVFIIHYNYKNIFFNVLNTNCTKQIFSLSLGLTNFKSLDRISKKYLILQVFKKIKAQTKKHTNIAIHIYSKNLISVKLILNFLKKIYLIQNIKLRNNLPHNGCRPRKKVRK